jgi:hypothetical protein
MLSPGLGFEFSFYQQKQFTVNCIPSQLACYNGMVRLLVIILLAETQVM